MSRIGRDLRSVPRDSRRPQRVFTVLAAFAVLASLTLLPDPAYACSCAVPAGASSRELVRQELSYSEAVFAGRVVDIDGPLIPTSSAAPLKVTFRVSEAWKGARHETLDVQTAVSDVSCGYPFDGGESYLVFASKGMFYEEGMLEAGLCGNTRPLSEAGKTLDTLGPGAAPAGSPSAEARLPDTFGFGRALLFAPGAAALVFAVAAVRLAVRAGSSR